MKPGTTTITPPTLAGFPPTIHVGDNDRAVRVSFGAIQIFLSNQSHANVIIVRAEPGDEQVRIDTRGATDICNQIEFHVEVLAPQG